MPRVRLIGLMLLFVGPAVLIYTAFSVYPLPTPDTNCRLMDFARDGTLWCMSSRVPKLVRLAVKPGGPAAYSPALSAPIPHQP